MAQIVLQNPWALLLLPLGWLLLLQFAWRRRFKPFGAFLTRLLIVVVVTLALARPIIPPEDTPHLDRPERLVVLVDQSASLGAVGQQALRSEAARLVQNKPAAHIVFFADRPLLAADPLAAPTGSQLNPEATDLAGALRFAENLLSAGDEPARLILLSDGVPTSSNVPAVVNRLAAQNIPVDVLEPSEADLQAWHDGQNEVRVVDVQVPPVLRQGETYDIETRIYTERPVSVTLKLVQNQAALAEDVVPLSAGDNRFTVSATARETGLHTFRATIAAGAGDDRQLQNNSISAFTQVYPPPQILVVAFERPQGSRFAALLDSAGYETRLISPEDMPTRISQLEPYAGMVLIDVPADSLRLEQMIAVQEFVRSMGRGLLVTGGRNSFSLGRYEDTPLAELLPLSLEPPPREERPPVALLLIIDHSGSMTEKREPATRLTMAKEAAIRATDILGPDDLLGVLMFDNMYQWVVDFQKVSDGAQLLEIQQRIARIPGGGGTRILQALEAGIPALIEQDSAISRHIVLLTDGKSYDGTGAIDAYNEIVDRAVEAGITLSTIAIGSGADTDLLSSLAERGGGRYHFAEVPEELPALTISESDILRSEALQEGDFGAAVFAPHPMLRGLFSTRLGDEREQPPPVNGYLAMTPKPQAEVALQVGPGDPLLAVWGYGLGRVAAWSSDLGAEWASAWRRWAEAGRFWGQVVGYTVPAPDLPTGLQLEAIPTTGDIVRLRADSLTAAGWPVDLAATGATLTTPAGGVESFSLRQIGPGLYERRLKLADSGAYRYTIEQDRAEKDGGPTTATTGLVQPYPVEYADPPAGSGASLLEQLASATKGRVFGLGELFAAETPSPADAGPPAEPLELWPWLLQIALVLWPIEIALRRWGRLRIQ